MESNKEFLETLYSILESSKSNEQLLNEIYINIDTTQFCADKLWVSISNIFEVFPPDHELELSLTSLFEEFGVI